jgi:putative DNA primase/helicase
MTELGPVQFLSKIWPLPLLKNETLEMKVIQREEKKIKRTFSTSVDEFLTRAKSYGVGWDIYFGISTRYQEGGKKQDCYRINCVWLDLDKTINLPTFGKIQPDIIVNSGGGFHCYWLLNSPIAVRVGHLEEIEAVNRGLCKEFGGDRMSIDITRVLRVPSFNNHKYMPVRKVVAYANKS